MKKQTLKLVIFLLLASEFSHAESITSLLRALEGRPQTTLDALDVQRGVLGIKHVSDKLMPKADAFAGYEMYNTPIGLLPVTPRNMFTMIQDPSISQPFSKKIARLGVQFSWPVFVKSLYTLKEKASIMHLAAKDKKRLNLIQREAEVVGAVAYLAYMESLKGALFAKEKSIFETRKKVSLMVKEGRAAESQLLTLDTSINDLKINLIGIEEQINTLKAKIETLTGIRLKHSLKLREKNAVKKGEIFALVPLQKKVEASQKGIKAAKESYYPTVSLKGNYIHSNADAYNTNDAVNSNYGSLGAYINISLFDSSKSTSLEEAKLDYYKEQSQLDEMRNTLEVRAKELREEIKLLKRSLGLAEKSIRDQRELLSISKVSLANDVITQEEYLRYEDALANAKANLYKIRAQKWQDIAQLAVLYGNDLKRIVK